MKKFILGIIFLMLVLGCNKITTISPFDNDSESSQNELDSFVIYDVHEQIESLSDAPKFLTAMDKAAVDKAVLLGSPEATFYYIEGFKNHHENNRELMKMAKEYPDRFIVFPTIDPRDPTELEIFKSYINEGAMGLRLFSGQYAWFYRHIGPVNRTELYPVLKYCQDNDIPIMFNMNPGKGNLQEEFEDVLKKYPNIKIICPHFCLSSIESERFEYLMDTYPNLYTDISFGHFFEDGLKRISKNVSKFRYLMNKYQDRMLFGTDMVITYKTGNSSDWMYNLTMCYRNMLEKENYDCAVKIKKVFNVSLHELKGLALDKELLEKIYYKNPRRYLGLNLD